MKNWEPPKDIHPDCQYPDSVIRHRDGCWICRQLHFEEWVQKWMLSFIGKMKDMEEKPASNIDPRSIPGALEGRGVRR